MFALRTMDIHSKHACVVGSLHVAFYLIKLLHWFFPLDYDFYFLFHPILAYYVLFITSAGLMIRGVLKKRHLFLLPFLVLCTAVLAEHSVIFLAATIRGSFDQLSIYGIGAAVLYVYPTYTLFTVLRSQSVKERTLEVKSVASEK